MAVQIETISNINQLGRVELTDLFSEVTALECFGQYYARHLNQSLEGFKNCWLSVEEGIKRVAYHPKHRQDESVIGAKRLAFKPSEALDQALENSHIGYRSAKLGVYIEFGDHNWDGFEDCYKVRLGITYPPETFSYDVFVGFVPRSQVEKVRELVRERERVTPATSYKINSLLA